MTPAPADPPPRSGLPRQRFWTLAVQPGPILLWAGAQTLVLLLAGANAFPLACQPADVFAPRAWIVSQWLVLALAWPVLLSTAGTSLAAALLLWPYGLLAGLLAGSMQGVVPVALAQSLWVLTLATGLGPLRCNAARVALSHWIRLWIVGGVVLAYLAADQSPPAATALWISHLDPLIATLTFFAPSPGRNLTPLLLFPAVLMASTLSVRVLFAYFSRRETSGIGLARCAAPD